MITGYSNTVSVTTLESPFQFTVDTSQSGVSGSTEFTMPLTTSTGLDMYVDWGDGSAVENITDHTLATHDYGTAGTYTISVTGDILGWQFNNGGDKLKMGDVEKWGALNISVGAGFRGCTNMTCSATDAPTITTTGLNSCFANCTNFNGAIGNWDISNVTRLDFMFLSATSFNQDIGNWDTSSVNTISGMFQGATSFNNAVSSNINNWNTSNVTNMSSFLLGANSFNQNISSWDTSNVTNMSTMFYAARAFNQDIGNWNTSNVTNMSTMFRDARAFDQDISSWNTSNVTNMSTMFRDAVSFDQDISTWDINQVNNFGNFMLSATGLSTANYDALLVGWEAQAPTYSGAIDFGGSQYSAAGYAARQSLISNYGWTITDGGSTMDADAVSFFDRVYNASGALSVTEIEATDTLVQQMKADGIWSSMKAIYPMVGASSAACAQNLKSSSFTGSFTSGWTFASTGVTPNGTSAYMDTGLNLNTMNSINDISYGYYCRTNTQSQGSFGWGVGGFIGNEFWIRYTDPNKYGYLFDSGNDGGATSDCRGFNAMSRIASTTKYIQINSTISTFSSASSGSLSSRNFFFGRGSQGYEDRENALGFVGDGLTSANLSDFYTAVQAFQTTLSREV